MAVFLDENATDRSLLASGERALHAASGSIPISPRAAGGLGALGHSGHAIFRLLKFLSPITIGGMISANEGL